MLEESGVTVNKIERATERWAEWEQELARRGIRVSAAPEETIREGESQRERRVDINTDFTLKTDRSQNTELGRYLKDIDTTDNRTPRERLEEYLRRRDVRPIDAESA